MDISLIAIPYSNDVSRWGGANGPQAFVDAGLGQTLDAHGHGLKQTTWTGLTRMALGCVDVDASERIRLQLNELIRL